MIYRHARLFPKLARAAVGTSRSGAPTLKALTSNSSSPAPTSRKEVCLLGVLGTFSGCIGPLVGVGGGIISIPIWREFTTLPQKYLSATSLVAVGVSACAASVAFVQAGQPLPFLSLPPLTRVVAAAMSLSSTYFATKGAKLASKFSDKLLQRCLGCFMLVTVPLVVAKTAWWRETVAASSESSEQSPVNGSKVGQVPSAFSTMKNRAVASLRKRRESASELFAARLPRVSEAFQRVSESLKHARERVHAKGHQLYSASRSKLESYFPRAALLLASAGLFEPGSLQRGFGYLLIGAAAGCMSGMLGVGGGVVITPALAAFSSMPHLSILGTAMLTMIPATVSGTLQHAAARNILWPQAAALAVGSVVGAAAGSNAALVVSDDALRVVFAVMMSVFGARTLLR